jgi:hypothetical protein
MIRENVTSLQGFAWYVRKRPTAEPSGPGKSPFDGVNPSYRPVHWPVGRDEAGLRNRGPGPAFLALTPALTFGPPEVGWKWQVEPAQLDGFRTEDGRVRLVGAVRRRTQWGIVTECEFEAVSLPSEDPWSRPHRRMMVAGCDADHRRAGNYMSYPPPPPPPVA